MIFKDFCLLSTIINKKITEYEKQLIEDRKKEIDLKEKLESAKKWEVKHNELVNSITSNFETLKLFEEKEGEVQETLLKDIEELKQSESENQKLIAKNKELKEKLKI